MIDDDIRRLNQGGTDPRLDGLEADIWSSVARRLEADQLARKVLRVQTALMAAALILAVALGSYIGQSTAQSAHEPSFADLHLAPSTLLLGHQT